MNKLTLEHLAGYLPYDTGIMVYSKNQPVFQSKLNPAFYGDSTGIKLILRPLSDLTEEIEVGGEKFVPIIELAKLFHVDSKYKVTHYTEAPDFGSHFRIRCNVENDNERYLVFGISRYTPDIPYGIIQKLYSWHFDIHNLINEGLAIDINTL